MVAKKVSIHTRKAGDEQGWLWESTGDGTYTIAEAKRETHGTTVTVELQEPDPEGGLKDYVAEFVIREIVTKYSDFVSYPIVMNVEREEIERDEQGVPREGAEPRIVSVALTLNSMKAIWTRSDKDVSEDEYREFYQHLTRDWNAPLTHVTAAAEGATEFRMLLYIPSKAPFDLFMRDAAHGVHLYIKRIFIMSDCKELLPFHMRFVKGVVDSEDLSLNISRELLQQDRTIRIIKRNIVRKVLKTLEALKTDEGDKYKTFWTEFGKVLKEGIFHDAPNREKILELSLFDSTHSEAEPTTLDEYIERMKEDDGHETIYFMTGKSRRAIADSPHLEAFRAKGYEVLLLSDPVDEMWTQTVFEYKGKRFQSVGKGTVDLDAKEAQEESEGEESSEERPEEEKTHEALLQFLQQKLEQQVKEVRLSTRLTTSPACLVGEESDLSPQLEQMLRASGQDVPEIKRILELNPTHPLLGKLQVRFEADQDDPKLDAYAHVLYGQAILAEGGTPADPALFSRHLTTVLLDAV